jgi:Na+-transporting NADH:ubiquinone oxidoreductase subunit NqrC
MINIIMVLVIVMLFVLFMGVLVFTIEMGLDFIQKIKSLLDERKQKNK